MTQKLYLANPYLREIDARIIDKIYKDGKYYIKFNRTIFYPHLSGGQPGDKGTINGTQVLEVYEEDMDIVHVVKENIHSDKVLLNIDWENRLDNMQQHTGQHLLSAAFYKLYSGETVGFHIGSDYVYVDITLPELSEEEAMKIEIYVNRIISSNFEIKSYYIEKDNIEKIPVKKQLPVNSNIRIVEIDNIDFCPCAGTHLRNTGEIGLIKIRKWEKYKGNIRVEFICGNRALLDYHWKSKAVKDISLLLSSKDTDVLEKVTLLYNQKEELERINRTLRTELIKFKGEGLLQNSIKIKNISFIFFIFDDMDMKEISAISNNLSNTNDLVQLYGSIHGNDQQFLISVSENLNIPLRDIYKEISKAFEVKGGGSSYMVQGRYLQDDLQKFLDEFFERIKIAIE